MICFRRQRYEVPGAGVTGHTMIIEVNIVKMTEDAALVEGSRPRGGYSVTRGKLSFARKIV